jgi:hypothetical protein
VDIGQQTPGRVQLAVDECGIENQLGPLIGKLCLPPVFDLALHGFEVPLDPVHSDGKSINQIEALAVLSQDRSEIAAEGHVGTDKNAQTRGQAQAQRLVVRVANADREAASFHLGLQIENSKHLHAVVGSGIFFIHHCDVAKAQGFNQRLNNLVMRLPAGELQLLVELEFVPTPSAQFWTAGRRQVYWCSAAIVS